MGKVYRIGYVLRVYPTSTIVDGVSPQTVKLFTILKNDYATPRSAYNQIGIRAKQGKLDHRNQKKSNDRGEYEVYEWRVLEYDSQTQEYTILGGRNLTRTAYRFPAEAVAI